jgi:hypothetical protein
MTVVAFATIIGGLLLAKQASSTTDTTDMNTTTTTANCNGNDFPYLNNSVIGFGLGFGGPRAGFGGGPGLGHRGGLRGFGPVEVSEEFKQTVTNIAESDTDVQNLLTEGYNVTSIKPVIKSVIDAEGYITTRATSAVLILHKDTSGCAFVSVNIEEAKVTEIVILTRTVIGKS